MSAVPAHGPTSRLLHLPEAALVTVLEQLDPCSLANTAVSCTALSHAVPSNISTVAVRCKSLQALDSLVLWFDNQRTSLNRLTSCDIDGGLDCNYLPEEFPEDQQVVRILPCPELRQLRLQMLKLQLDSAAGCPGVLRHCTGLTALDLRHCLICDAPAVSAAITALSQLQDLHLENNWDAHDQRGRYPFATAQLPTSLTRLTLRFTVNDNAHFRQLGLLSALVNLKHMELSRVGHRGVPRGLPPQLVKLTCLRVQYEACGGAAVQDKHLSALTALRELSIKVANSVIGVNSEVSEGDLSGIAHLAQLTSLELESSDLYISEASTLLWARLTALHSFSLSDGILQLAALAPLAQLQSLSLSQVRLPTGTPQHELFAALSHLTQLTHLMCCLDAGRRPLGAHAPAGAFTALTASTALCSLVVCISPARAVPPDPELFRPQTMYPNLRQVHLQSIVPSQQQLQRLCTCCPAVDSLEFALVGSMPPTACVPLLQLSALTNLCVPIEGDKARAPDTAAGLIDVAAQLTGLRSLTLGRVLAFDLSPVVLLQLTSLRALESLTLAFTRPRRWILHNKAAGSNPPDVWIQLLRGLVQDAPCRQALLLRSVIGAAAPAELMLAQLAATLAAELGDLEGVNGVGSNNAWFRQAYCRTNMQGCVAG